MLPDVLSIFVDLYAQVLGFLVFQWAFFSKVLGLEKSAI